MARITIDVDLTPEVEITGYQRYQDGHGLEVRWPLPARCRCEKCGHDDVAHIEFKTIPPAIRDLNLWEQPCFWIYQAPFHRCARCNYRQHIIPPFKRKDVSYTYRFEQFVLRSLIGSTAEEVARRLGISAETVDRIVENQLTEDRQIDPQRVITDIGLDELSLKKRHRLYVTLMTDLSDPTRPQILAVERGRDTTATLKCLDRLTQEQRQQVRTHRVDMGPAYPAACALRLPHSRAVTDRFHVAKKFHEVVDSLRKNITREYKAKLTKDQQKAFRSQMWAFRRDPESLSAEEKPALEALFEKIPALRPLYKVRLRFKEIFDTARDRITAARWLRELRRECGQLGLDLGSFFETYDRWKTKILNYFDARQTSAAVEGINNKARVITKRTYGLKSAKSLWDRLILDLNRASQAIGYSIEHIRQMAKGLKALFDWFALKNGRTAEIAQVGITARLHAKARGGCAGQVHRHVERRPAIEGERRRQHAPVPQGDQLGDSPAVGFLDQLERVRSVVRRSPDGVGAARALFPHGLAARDQFGPRRARRESPEILDGGPL